MDFSKGSYRLVFDNMQTDSIKLGFFFFSSLLTSSTHQTQLHNLHFLQKCSFKQDLSSTSSALSAFMLSLQCCCGNMLIWVKKKNAAQVYLWAAHCHVEVCLQRESQERGCVWKFTFPLLPEKLTPWLTFRINCCIRQGFLFSPRTALFSVCLQSCQGVN